MNTDAIAAVLTDATPILAATVWPVLATTAGVSLWWLSQDTPDNDDDFNVDDYRQPATVRVRTHHTHVDGPTQVIRRPLRDAGTPLYDQLTAKQTAQQWLRELGERARTEATA